MSSRSRRSRSENLAPALFPFLAVLVCTMGALVLILVIVVSQASASAKLTLQAEEDTLLEVSDLVEVASEEMIARRTKQQEAIDNRRSQLAAIEDHITRLIDELKRLGQTAEAIQQQTQQTDLQREEQQQRLDALEKQMRDEQENLEDLRSKADEAMPAFAILPYQGNRGTTRRPIYLECNQRGVVIQPEGVVISMEDLKPPHGPGNPLDASLRLIRATYQRLDPTASSAVSPYPLLLVRPDGIKSYVLARAAMSGWDDQFGYELIDQAMPLAFPPSIPGLGRQLSENLEIARQRQIALIAAMPRRYGSEHEWDDALESIDQGSDLGSGGAASGDRHASSHDWTSIDQAIASSSSSSPNPKGWEMIAEFPNPPAGGQSPSRPPPATHELAMPSADMRPSATASSSLPSSHDIQRMQRAAQQGLLDSAGPFNDQDPSALSGDWSDPASGETLANGLDQEASLSATSSPSNLQTASNSNATVPSPTNQPPPSMQAMNADSSAPQRNAMSFSSPMNPAGPEGNASVMPASERDSANASPSIDLSPRSSNQSARNKPQASSHAPVRTWTSKRRNMNGTPVSRPIHLVAMSDRWLIMQDNGHQQVEKVIPLNMGPSAVGQQLEAAIDARVEAWGVAVAGGHWQPKLSVEYAPDAETSVQRLKKILDGSGLDLQLQPLR